MIHAIKNDIERRQVKAMIKLGLLSLLASVALQASAQSPDPLTDEFTSVQLDYYIPYLNSSLSPALI